jgi:hypothetical protein
VLGSILALASSRDRGQGNIGSLFIGVMVAAILGVGVAIPVVLDIINQANVSGTTATILDLVPLFIALLLLVALAGPLMRRVQ